MKVPVAQVALPLPLPRLFDYQVPAYWSGQPLQPGQRVLVEFGTRHLVGVIAAVTAASGEGLKPLLELLDQQSLFDPALWATLDRVARYYHAGLGETLATALPKALRRTDAGPRPPQSCLYALLPAARANPPLRLGKAQKRLWDCLDSGIADAQALAALHPRWRPQVQTWIETGLVEAIALSPFAPPPVRAPGPQLVPEQAAAILALGARAGEFAVSVLEGVTGSGKTEVYLQLLQQVVARGRQGLLLVPEIGLTPQSIARVRERLDARVAALHSDLADGERMAVYTAAARGEIDVLVGTRSAVLTPLPRLGLIVVDEEHDSSYKQQEGIRYHARDVALLRAQASAANVVLGSATPSLESLRNVALGRFQRLHLRQRVGGAVPPRWSLVDLRQQSLVDGLAPATLTSIGRHLRAGGQVLVFKNRRGYAPTLLCRDCGWHAQCPDCDIGLTWHRQQQALRCHHCGYQRRAPNACPECGGLALTPLGAGTERLEEALAKAFPTYPLVRLDRDTTARKHSFAAAIDELLKGVPSLIVGTQMLAKGHHLPAVTLAVIVGVDEGLMSTDFRAGERLAQLIVQVAGRSGRAERPGEVLLQTHQPEHPLLGQLLSAGYAAVADELLAERQAIGLPPAVHAAMLRAEHPQAERAEAFLQKLLDVAGPARQGAVDLAGPLAAPQAKRQGRWRFQLVLQSSDRAALHQVLTALVVAAHRHGRDRALRWSVDVDPVDYG